MAYTHTGSEQGELQVSQSQDEESIAQRDEGGHINVADGEEENHAVNYNQLSALAQEISGLLAQLDTKKANIYIRQAQ
jgi:hypothetical protein